MPPRRLPPASHHHRGPVTGFKLPRALVDRTRSLEARVFVAQTSLYGGPRSGAAPDLAGEVAS